MARNEETESEPFRGRTVTRLCPLVKRGVTSPERVGVEGRSGASQKLRLSDPVQDGDGEGPTHHNTNSKWKGLGGIRVDILLLLF